MNNVVVFRRFLEEFYLRNHGLKYKSPTIYFLVAVVYKLEKPFKKYFFSGVFQVFMNLQRTTLAYPFFE